METQYINCRTKLPQQPKKNNYSILILLFVGFFSLFSLSCNEKKSNIKNENSFVPTSIDLPNYTISKVEINTKDLFRVRINIENKLSESQFMNLDNQRTYEYEERTYTISPHQIKILNHIKDLPKKHLHYLVGQQSLKHNNLTLKELKRFIKNGINKYCESLNLPKQTIEDNKYLKFFCVFETTEDFYNSQYQNKIVDEDIVMGIHFHLFISSVDNYPWISFPSLFHYIFNELTQLPHKRMCIRKYDYKKLDKLNENFILYHTKQFRYCPNSEMLMKNF